MNNKKIIIIPPLSSFEKVFGIHNREIKGAVFIPNKTNYPNLSSLESTLSRLKYIKVVGWFTNEKGYQRGSNRINKLFDLYSKSAIDIIICYSQKDLLICKSSLENSASCIIIKDTENIPLS